MTTCNELNLIIIIIINILYYTIYNNLYNCERSELSGEFNGTDFLYNIYNIYILYKLYAVRRAVNVLCVSKYPPNAIFRSANINAQRANVTRSMNWHNTQSQPPM